MTSRRPVLMPEAKANEGDSCIKGRYQSRYSSEAKTLQMLNPITNARSARWLRPAALKGVWMILA